jgi:3D (Asp-Asp-Asp) domain-containing protein
MCTFFNQIGDEIGSKRRSWTCLPKEILKKLINFKNFYLKYISKIKGIIIFVILFSPYMLVEADNPKSNTLNKINSFDFYRANSSPPFAFYIENNDLKNIKIIERVNQNSQNYVKKYLWVTAYSSSPDETDEDPFITATGKEVRDGIVATNILPFGTKIKIPSLFGDKIFVVEDRMHYRKTNVIDVWMESKEKALNFGAHYTEVLILKEDQELAKN